MITAAFVTVIAAAALANLGGHSSNYAGLIACTIWFFFCRALPPRGWRWLIASALWISVAIAALVVVQVALWMPRARGPFASPNFLGAYAALMVFLTVMQNGRNLCTFYAAANLISIALSQSRGALLALGAGLVTLFARKRPVLCAGLCLGLVAGALLIRPDTTNPRTEIWRLAFLGAMQRPLTGWGQSGLVIGGLNQFYSIPLEWFANAGILGVLAGGWLLAVAWWRAKNEPAIHAFLAAWFVQGLFLFSIPATNLLLVTVLAYLSRASLPASGPMIRECHPVDSRPPPHEATTQRPA